MCHHPLWNVAQPATDISPTDMPPPTDVPPPHVVHSDGGSEVPWPLGPNLKFYSLTGRFPAQRRWDLSLTVFGLSVTDLCACFSGWDSDRLVGGADATETGSATGVPSQHHHHPTSATLWWDASAFMLRGARCALVRRLNYVITRIQDAPAHKTHPFFLHSNLVQNLFEMTLI